ncbi:MAG: ABC transporter ATP-binding protein [Kiritimatiellia bacterium]
MNSPCLELQNLHRRFPSRSGPRELLRGISLTLYPGERILLYGPSGCGKTTLLHLMAFLDQPDEGEILFQGKNSRNWGEDARCQIRAREIGMVFQQFHLLPHHSVRDNLLLRMRYLRGTEAVQSSAMQLLEEVGLEDRPDQPARLLSGGEKQRLCIARALLLHPALFLADEPTGNLDPENAENIRRLFAKVSERGAAMVIATHDPEWFSLATRIFRFEAGQLTEEKP